MTINKYLQITKDNCYGNKPRLYCADGFSVSVQANRFVYCTPRVDNASYYSSVELGYPSMVDELIIDYAEDDNYTNTVYGYVPVHIVDALIKKHGGIEKRFLEEGLA